jgi:Protein of unknown function (DUF1761)
MHITGINYPAVAIAAIASFIFGGIWYGLLSKQWMAAANLDEKFVKGSGTGPSPVPFAVAFVALLVMAWMLAGVFLHLSRGGVPMTMRSGLISGALIWAGFVMTSLVVNHAFQGAKRTLTLIDGGHWLGVLLVQSAVLILMSG